MNEEIEGKKENVDEERHRKRYFLYSSQTLFTSTTSFLYLYLLDIHRKTERLQVRTIELEDKGEEVKGREGEERQTEKDFLDSF